MSHFAFLRAEWPAVHEAATKAEQAAHPDPRAACFYARRALELGLVDEINLDLAAAVASAALVIVAVPMDAMLAVLPQVLDLLTDKQLVIDVGSLAVAEAARRPTAQVRSRPRTTAQRGLSTSVRAALGCEIPARPRWPRWPEPAAAAPP